MAKYNVTFSGNVYEVDVTDLGDDNYQVVLDGETYTTNVTEIPDNPEEPAEEPAEEEEPGE